MDEQASLGLAEVLLGELSPAELELIDDFGPLLLTGGVRGDGALGFGVDDVAWLSAAVPVAGLVVDQLLDILKDAASDALKDKIKAWLAGLRWQRRAPHNPAPAVVALPPDVAARAAQLAFDHSRTLGLSKARARLLADAVEGAMLRPAVRPSAP